jgi:hypothetical protein
MMTDQVVNELIMPVVVGLTIAVGSIIATQLIRRRR